MVAAAQKAQLQRDGDMPFHRNASSSPRAPTVKTSVSLSGLQGRKRDLSHSDCMQQRYPVLLLAPMQQIGNQRQQALAAQKPVIPRSTLGTNQM